MKYISIILIALLVIGLGFFGFSQYKKAKVVTNFIECEQAGYPVSTGLSPRQCLADGVFYTEVLAVEPDPYADMIQVTSPGAGAIVTSPLTITGQAKGGWYFEASFPVRLLDGNGNQIAIAPAQAQGDWMTEDFVPFSVTLTFTKPATPTGTLILQKDNPSGEPQFDGSISIPVNF